MKQFQSLLILALSLPLLTFAQDLSGVWEGSTHAGPMRLVIVQKGDSCFGYVFEGSIGKCTAHFEGRYNASKRELIGSSPGFIKRDFGHGLSRYKLGYDSVAGKESLSGNLRPKSTAAQIFSFGMFIHCDLYRTSKIPDTTSYMMARLNRLPVDTTGFTEPATAGIIEDSLQKPAVQFANRPSQELHNISTSPGIIRCTLYDNGVYDHDTVTVIHNGKVIMNAVEISSKPLKFEIQLSKDEPVHEIIFYANNLGAIPPNTGLLLIETSEKRYELDFKADKNTNGKLTIRLLK